MCEQQINNAIFSILFGGIGAAIVGAIFKGLLDRKLQTQKHDFDKQLESLKFEFGEKNTVHKMQFEKEFHLYEELWKALVDVQATATITPSLDKIPKDRNDLDVYKERFENAVNAFNKANDLFKYHRPFYHDDVSKITEDILNQCRSHIKGVGRSLSSKKFDEKLFDSTDELFEQVSDAINKIGVAIKQRVGLLQEAEIVE